MYNLPIFRFSYAFKAFARKKF